MQDVIVIGSGLSALTAARVLKAHKPLLLEARNRVGGRANTYKQCAQPVDLGCSMVHGVAEGNPITQTLKEYGLPYPHVVRGSEIMVIGASGPLSSIEAATLFSDSASKAFSPGHPPPSSDTSLASVVLPQLSSDNLKALARTTEIGAGVPLEDLSAKWWGFGRGFAGTDGFPAGGYCSLVDKLVEEVEAAGGGVQLEKEVVSVEDLGKDKGVRVTLRNGEVHEAKVVLSTIPLAVLQQRSPTFAPPLPPATLGAIQRTRTGVLEKVVLSYSKAWWTESTKYGTFLLLPTAPPSSDAARPSSLEELFSRTTLSVTSFARVAAEPHPTLLIYLGAASGTFIADYAPSEVISALHDYLASRIPFADNSQGTLETPNPNASTVTNWLTDPYSLGATSSPVTLLSSDDGERASPLDFVTLSRSHWDGRLGFAGEHTDLDHRGSAAGAVVSGQREGERIKGLLERLAGAEAEAKL